MRPVVAIALVAVLGWTASAQTPREEEMRARVTSIGQGYMAVVKLERGGKLTGRIGAIAERDFVLEEVRERKLQDQTVAFSDIKSVEPASVGRAGSVARLVVVTAGALGFAVLLRVLLARR